MIKTNKMFSSTIKTLSICLIFAMTFAVGVMAFNIPEKNVLVSENTNNNNEEMNQDVQVVELAKVEQGGLITKETIEVVTEEIPYETINKDGAKEGEANSYIAKKGVNGKKEITYKVKYENDIEISREEISSKTTKKAVNKVVAKKMDNVVVASRSEETNSSNNKTEDGDAVVKKMNVSAYCSCSSCCGKTNGITASGSKATSWYTIAAGKGYPIGTRIYIPYFKDKPNGGWFVVQDRGGAISNSKIDIYMDSHSQALQFGRKNLECYIYY